MNAEETAVTDQPAAPAATPAPRAPRAPAKPRASRAKVAAAAVPSNGAATEVAAASAAPAAVEAAPAPPEKPAEQVQPPPPAANARGAEAPAANDGGPPPTEAAPAPTVERPRDEARQQAAEPVAATHSGSEAHRGTPSEGEVRVGVPDPAPRILSESRDGRPQDSRGLRFRGRDARPGQRPGPMPPRRNDGRPDFRPDHRRPDNDANSANGRLAQRDGGPRQNDMAQPRRRHEYDLTTLEEMAAPELNEVAEELNIASAADMAKSDLVFRILEIQAETSGNQFKKGYLEILPDGKGFLRTEGYLPGNEDVYVSQSQIKRFNLRNGDMVSGQVRAPKEMERYFGLLRVEAINGQSPEQMRTRKDFDKLTPIFPDEKFILETTQENITARIIDLVSPIGKGQRGLIVAPPKAGKTTLIKNIANSIAANHPEVILIVLLIDERPEEVTDISRSVKGEVVASTFDELPENHMRVADTVLEKAKRLVEMKHDVVILLDSITRLSRASNLVVTPSGRTLSGGLDPAAMYRPKRMFGAARNIEEGGSLTILATTLVDTGSRMDEMIFEEFKGTGNMDLVLDRSLFDQRIFPAIDINKTGTRRDDLLLSKDDLAATFHLRRTLQALDNDKAVTLLIDRLKNTKTNEDFMQIVQKSSRQAVQ